MPETSKSLFYNSQNGDRLYDADSFEHWLKRFFTSGVFTGCCQVTASGSGMACTMSAGYANVDGKVRFFDESVTLTLQNAHSTYDRIDTIVVERNDVDREITVKVVTGSYSAIPVATAPVRSGGIYQLVLAEVYIAAGTVSINQGNITDKRPDTSVCGYVVSAVSTPDFSELYTQFSSQFAEWFEHMKDQLDEDAAGHLQNEIDTLAEQQILKKTVDITIPAGLTSLVYPDAWITENTDCYVHNIARTNTSASISWSFNNGHVDFQLSKPLSYNLSFSFGMIK